MANKQLRLDLLLTSLTSFDNKQNPSVQLVLIHSVEIGGKEQVGSCLQHP